MDVQSTPRGYILAGHSARAQTVVPVLADCATAGLLALLRVMTCRACLEHSWLSTVLVWLYGLHLTSRVQVEVIVAG